MGAVSTLPPTDVNTATRDDLRKLLLDVRQVADMLGCSTRHVWTMRDCGKMPRPVKLGALIRWRADDIREWVSSGCPDCRQAKGGRS